MSETALQLLPTLFALTAEDREMVARELIASLPSVEDDEEREFIEMLHRRAEAMERDPSRRLPALETLQSHRKAVR